MAQLHQLLFRHIAPLQAEVAPLPGGGALFATEGFSRFLRGGLPLPDARGPAPFAGPPDWNLLRRSWAQISPMEPAPYERWLAGLSEYGRLDWSTLQETDL